MKCAQVMHNVYSELFERMWVVVGRLFFFFFFFFANRNLTSRRGVIIFWPWSLFFKNCLFLNQNIYLLPTPLSFGSPALSPQPFIKKVGGVINFLLPEPQLAVPFICSKFLESAFKCFRVRGDTISILKYNGAEFLPKCIWSYGSSFLYVVSWCFIFAQMFMKMTLNSGFELMEVIDFPYQ